MLKRKLNAAITTAILLAGPAIVPVVAHGSSPDGPAAQQDKMKHDKTKGDKMAGDKMASHKMSSKKHRHRRHRKHKSGDKMNKMEGNKNQ